MMFQVFQSLCLHPTPSRTPEISTGEKAIGRGFHRRQEGPHLEHPLAQQVLRGKNPQHFPGSCRSQGQSEKEPQNSEQ